MSVSVVKSEVSNVTNATDILPHFSLALFFVIRPNRPCQRKRTKVTKHRKDVGSQLSMDTS